MNALNQVPATAAKYYRERLSNNAWWNKRVIGKDDAGRTVAIWEDPDDPNHRTRPKALLKYNEYRAECAKWAKICPSLAIGITPWTEPFFSNDPPAWANQ